MGEMDQLAGLRSVAFEGRRGTDPVIFSQTRHFAFSRPDGRMRIESAAIGDRGCKLFGVHSTGHEVALAEEVHVNVILPLRGRVDVATKTSDWTAGVGDLLVFGPNERRTIVAPDQAGLYEALLLAIPRDALGGEVAAEPGRLARAGEAAALAREMSDLMALLRRGAASGETLAVAAEQLTGRLAAALAETRPGRRAATGSLAQLGRAEAFMEAHAGLPIRIESVAAEAGLSVRGLQATFRRYRGLTPHQALTRARLEQVRLRLVRGDPDDPLTDLALQCRLTHL